MASSTVIRLPSKEKSTAPRQIRNAKHSTLRNVKAVRALRRQAATAIGIGFVAATLVILSLSHLAHGIEVITGCQSWEGWALAVGIDCGYVSLELSQLAIGEKLRRQVGRITRITIASTLIGSCAANAFAFCAATASLPMMAAAIMLGVAIPGMVFALTKVGAALWIDTHARG